MINKKDSLPKNILDIVLNKGTETPYSGEHDDLFTKGTYLCRLCGIALYRSHNKFASSCGWPSFDQELAKRILYQPDRDGKRIEILCQRCHAHLGHVFKGEGFTARNTRHCVNSLSLDFIKNNTSVLDTEEAIVAAGCFWGVEHLFKKFPGVVKTETGYSGGFYDNPTYELVCLGNTGHYEALRIVYDISKTSFESVLKFFFEIHDPTQRDGQGPDIGAQYQSAAFYYDDFQKGVIEDLISQLKNKGYDIKTKVLPISVFWKAEKLHQNYYEKTKKTPYCHVFKKIF